MSDRDRQRYPRASAGPAAGPDPTRAGSPAEFVDTMRCLKNVSGLSYRQLERRASANGEVLPRTTLMTALGRQSLPREELVAVFVRACGSPPAELDRWLLARRRLAGEGVPRPVSPLLPPIWYRLGRIARVLAAIAAAAVAAAALAGTTVLW